MKIPSWLPCYGDINYRGDCPREDAELMTFFNELKRLYPHLSAVAIHPDNEGLVIGAAHNAHIKQKAKGAMKNGASDIVIIGSPTFVCEMKRQDHTKSTWQKGQLEFLEASKTNGAFVCVALGYVGAMQAVKDWIK
jgi:hypothetical protein